MCSSEACENTEKDKSGPSQNRTSVRRTWRGVQPRPGPDSFLFIFASANSPSTFLKALNSFQKAKEDARQQNSALDQDRTGDLRIMYLEDSHTHGMRPAL